MVVVEEVVEAEAAAGDGSTTVESYYLKEYLVMEYINAHDTKRNINFAKFATFYPRSFLRFDIHYLRFRL